MNTKIIVLIGDSIRAGYQEQVRGQLADWANVWAPEGKGWTSEDILTSLDEWALSRTDVIHINCGLHDIKKEFNKDNAAVPLSAYTENVRRILTRLQAETEATVVWALTTPVNQEWHHRNKPFDRFEKDVVTYNAVASEISTGLGIAVNDLYSVVVSAGVDNILLADGFHFSSEGYALLGESVANCVRKFAGIADQVDAADS